MMLVEMLQLVSPVSGYLFFGRRNDGVAMLAEKDAAHALIGEETRSGALDAQPFDFLAAFTFELIFGERGVAREIGQQLEKPVGEFSEAADGNGAVVRTGACAGIRAHATEILFNLAARACCGAGANHPGGEVRDARRSVRGGRVAAANEKLGRNFREGVRFGEDDFQAIRQRDRRALRPGDRTFRPQRWRGGAVRVDCGHRARGRRRHRAPPFDFSLPSLMGLRTTMARLRGTKYFCATACACAGVTARKPSSTVLTRFGSPSKSVKHAR